MAFKLWCWRRLLRALWTEGRSSQSILKETNPKYSLEGVMLKLKLQYFAHLMQRTDSLEKTLMLGKIEGGRRGQQRMRQLNNITELRRAPVYRVAKSQTWLSNWTTTLIGITLKLQTALHSFVILTMLILLIQKHEISFYLFESSLFNFFISIFYRSQYIDHSPPLSALFLSLFVGFFFWGGAFERHCFSFTFRLG